MTGLELIKEMARIRPGVPTILCTGFARTTSEQQARELGVRDYLIKPLLLRQVAETVRRVLDEVAAEGREAG
jgi:YesN/AraC family two-component response regulator